MIIFIFFVLRLFFAVDICLIDRLYHQPYHMLMKCGKDQKLHIMIYLDMDGLHGNGQEIIH